MAKTFWPSSTRYLTPEPIDPIVRSLVVGVDRVRTGEGHEWSDGPPLRKRVTRVLGPQSSAVNANAVMWTFFSGHPLP